MTIVALAGVALGVLGVAADQIGSDFWMVHRPTPVAVGYLALMIAGNAAGFWALSAVLVAGLTTKSAGASILAGTAFLAIAVVTYYAVNVMVGARLASNQVGQATSKWLLVVAVVGPLAGLIAHWLRSPTTWQAALAVAGVIGLVLIDLLLVQGAGRSEYPLAMVIVVIAYLTVVSVLAWRATSRARPFLIGCGLAIVAGVLGAALQPASFWLQHG